MSELPGSETEVNLRAAFASESEANRRYLYFAQRADQEGYPDIAALFRSVAEGETGHAFGHLDLLLAHGLSAADARESSRPSTADNLRSAVAGENQDYQVMYPRFALVARQEGFVEIAEWFEMLARAEKSHASRFASGLDSLEQEESDATASRSSAR